MVKKLSEGHWPIFLISSFSSIANLFLPIVLTRILLPSEIGLYKIFFLHFAAIPYLFMTSGPIYSVYFWVGKEDSIRKEYLQQSFLLSLILSVLILLIGFPLIFSISSFIDLPWQYVGISLFSAFFCIPASYYDEVNIALGKTLKGSFYSVIFEIIKVIAFISIAIYFKNVGEIFLGYALILGIKFFISVALGLKDGFIKLKVDKRKLKEIFLYCLPISMAGTITFFIDKIDQFVLASQLTKDEFAFYSMGCLIVPPLFLLETSVIKVLVPKLSIDLNKNGGNALSYFKKAISDVGTLIIPAVIGLFYFAEPITELLYTEIYSESALYLKIFAISYLFFLIPYDAIPRATGNTKWIFIITLAIAPFSLAGVIISTMYFDAKTVLIVALSFKLITRVAGMIYSIKLTNWSLVQVIPFKKILVFTSISLALTFLCSLVENMFDHQINWFLTTAPIFLALYFFSLYIYHKKDVFHE